MITPQADARPNPDRAIYVQGEINQELIYRLTPQIIALKHVSRDPITVYIDSNGGSVELMETLLQIITASDQDLSPPGKLITVLTSSAASAAADLLSYGDYAVAYPGTSLLYHGTRVKHQLPLTTELSSLLSQYLREENNRYATKLAREIVDRFMFRFVTSKSQFLKIREEDPDKSELDCFLAFISDRLSPSAKRVLANAQSRYGRYDLLLDKVIMRMPTKKKFKSRADSEAYYIKRIVEFEARQHPGKDWSFSTGGMNTVTDDFFVLNEYLDNYRSGFFDGLCKRYGHWWLTIEENEELEKLPQEEQLKERNEKVHPLLLPVWSFFVALCHALQYGENELTAHDAVWLGLIDEVLGESKLPNRRMAWEYTEDEQAEKDKAIGEGAAIEAGESATAGTAGA